MTIAFYQSARSRTSFVLEPLFHSSFMAASSTRSNVQDLVLESGRHSAISTRSPTFETLFSSCTCSTVRLRMYLPYLGCLTEKLIQTLRVLSRASDLTMPTFRGDFSGTLIWCVWLMGKF